MSTSATIRISRRQFILGGGAIALLATAYAGLRQTGSYTQEKLSLSSLSDKEAAIYRCIGKLMLPGAPLPGNGGDDETISRIDQMLVGVPSEMRWYLAALPLAFEHGTALNRFGSKRLTELPEEEALDYLKRWADSRNLIKSQLLAAVKTLYGFSYFERDDVLSAMGMPPHCEVRS